MRLKIAWATDPGLEREENEDSVVVWRNKAGLDTLIVVCDGMGGHAAGQHASSIAVKTVTKVLAEDGQEGPDLDRLKRASKRRTRRCSRRRTRTPIGPAWAAPWSSPPSGPASARC